MSDPDAAIRFSYRGRSANGGMSTVSAGVKSKAVGPSVAELLAKSRIEHIRHQQNLRRLPHPDFATTLVSSVTTSTSYPLPASPFPLAESQFTTHNHPRRGESSSSSAPARSKRPPGPSAPASWRPMIPDESSSSTLGSSRIGRSGSSASKNIRSDPVRDLERRRALYALWFQYAYAGGRGVRGEGMCSGKGKQRESVIGQELVSMFALPWMKPDVEERGDQTEPACPAEDGSARTRPGVATLQSFALSAFTRYCLDLPLASSRAILQGIPSLRSQNEEQRTEEEDPLAYVRAVSSFLTTERRVGMMLARHGLAGPVTITNGRRARDHGEGGQTGTASKLSGVLGIWSGWEDVLGSQESGSNRAGGRGRGVANGGDENLRERIESSMSLEDEQEQPLDGVDEDEHEEEEEDSSDSDDWDQSSSAEEGLDAANIPPPIPILDLSFVPSLSVAEAKLLRAVLHSPSAYACLTRLSFAGSGINLLDALNMLPASGGLRSWSDAGAIGGRVHESKSLRLTHLSLAGLNSRDGKELERSIGKVLRLTGPSLEMLDLSEIGTFQSFGLWAILGTLFDPNDGSVDAASWVLMGKMPMLKILGLKGLLPSHVLAGTEEVRKVGKMYVDYVRANRAGKWVDLVFE